tara:strand:- start:1032 stop:1196 length:165 start_codon:yes stop_codon:yes gene_type:complete
MVRLYKYGKIPLDVAHSMVDMLMATGDFTMEPVQEKPAPKKKYTPPVKKEEVSE